jgi:hypothetical protein
MSNLHAINGYSFMYASGNRLFCMEADYMIFYG